MLRLRLALVAFPLILGACTDSSDSQSSTTDPVTEAQLAAVENTADSAADVEATAAGHCGGGEVVDRATPPTDAPMGPPEDGDRPDGDGGHRGGHGGHRGGHGGGHGGHGGGRGHAEHLLFIYDVDGDGTLSDAERAELLADLAAGCEARQAALLSEFDANGDGALDADELAAAQAARQAERDAREAERLAAFDANGDGTLDETEREAAHTAHEAEEAEAQAAVEAEYDADGDGALSEEEAATMREALREKIRSGEKPF